MGEPALAVAAPPAALPPAPPTPAIVAPLLAFTAGFVDTAGFIAIGGLFAAHVTGNLVLIGAALVHGSGGLVAKLAALPVFIATVAVVRAVLHGSTLPPTVQARRLMVAQIALLALFGVLGVILGPFYNPDSLQAVLTGMIAVAAMAIQNAVMRLHFATLTPTTVMTGNMTGLVVDAVDALSGRGGPEATARLSRVGRTILAFAVGCAAGAASMSGVGFLCVVIPVAAQVAVYRALAPAP